MTWMEWYNSLAKPAWTPAPPTIGMIWQILYPIIIVSFGFLFIQAIRRKGPWQVAVPFAINLISNLIFTPIQFGMRNLALASVDILIVWGSIVWMIVAVWSHYRWIAVAQIPYFIWVSIATVLQLSVTIMNWQSIPMPDESQVELTLDHEGTTYKLVDGNLYRVASPTRLVFVEEIYDTDFLKKNYTVQEGTTYRIVAETGQRFPTRRIFRDDFEDANQITDLINAQRGWTSFTLQSSSTPSVPEYVALRSRILRGEATFVDNRVEPSSEMAHHGIGALKCFSLPPTPRMVCAKASLSTELLYFAKGDDVWFSAWYYIPSDRMPFTLMDLECTWIKQHPGIRIMLEDGAVMFELKWGNKPKYRQPRADRVPIPIGQWVQLKARIHLSDSSDGQVQLWQDKRLLIDAQGQTLPLAGAIYDSLEIGISAHSYGPNPAIVYVDEVAIADQPLD